MSAYHLEDDGDLLRVYRVMDGHKVCVAVEAHTWRQGSEWTGAWLDADGTANELRHLVNCATACEGMGDPAAEIARLREDSGFLESYRTVAASKEADLREALDALDALHRRMEAAWRRGILPATCFSSEDVQAYQAILRKHGRAV